MTVKIPKRNLERYIALVEKHLKARKEANPGQFCTNLKEILGLSIESVQVIVKEMRLRGMPVLSRQGGYLAGGYKWVETEDEARECIAWIDAHGAEEQSTAALLVKACANELNSQKLQNLSGYLDALNTTRDAAIKSFTSD